METSKITGGQGSHNKPIGCGASGAYAPGPDDEENTTVAVGRTMILQYHITLHHIIGKGSFTFLSLGAVRMKTSCLCC